MAWLQLSKDYLPAKSLAKLATTTKSWWQMLTGGGVLAGRAARGRLDLQRATHFLLRLWRAESALLYEEFAPGWHQQWLVRYEDSQLRPVTLDDQDVFSAHGRLWLCGTKARLVRQLNETPSGLQVRLAVAARGDCALGHLTLEDDSGRACVWAYVERRTGPRSDFVGIPLCNLHVNLLDHQLSALPSGPSDFLTLAFDLDWSNRRLMNIRVDGILVAREDFKLGMKGRRERRRRSQERRTQETIASRLEFLMRARRGVGGSAPVLSPAAFEVRPTILGGPRPSDAKVPLNVLGGAVPHAAASTFMGG
eukprot:s28_g7.t1